jgi:uncharacterized protein YutD
MLSGRLHLLMRLVGANYEVLQDHKNGWNPEAFRDRYSEVLDRYDYIIGDWGYKTPSDEADCNPNRQ